MKINTKHKKLSTTLFVLFLLFFFNACGSYKNTEASKSSIAIESNPKIIFLNYSIKKNSNKVRSIRFIDKKITDGKLKNQSNDIGSSDDLVCFQLDKKSTILQETIIKNPLTKNIEYLDASKSFQRKQIDLDSTQFSIRLQLKPKTKYISISDFSTFENQGKSLIKTQIY